MKTPPPAELDRLLNAAADCLIDEADEQALAAWLKRDPAARQDYREFMILHASLHWDYVQSAMPAAGGEPETKHIVTVRAARRWWVATLAAAAVLLAALLLAKFIFPQGGEPSGQVSRTSVAVLSRAGAASWEGDAPQPGQALAPGWLQLTSGAVQIEFSRGARVVLEGPAEFQLVSDNEGFLQRGKLRAVVPEPARGFTIRGAGFSAVDLGTEFGCIAGDSVEVHVLAGTVALKASATERTLAKAEAVRFSAGRMENTAARPELFLSDERLAQMAASDAGSRLAAWRKASAALNAHPVALVHYDFEQTHGAARALTSLVPGREVPASIIGCEPAQGRWPGKGALEFKRAEDRVRFTVPGELKSLTLLAWVRVDALPKTQSSLLMGESELPGEVHWYLNDKGHIGLAIIAPEGRWRALHTEPLLRPALFGKWIFLAATFDGATRTATQYVNGQRVAAQVLDGVGPLRLRTVEIGNWGVRPGMPLRASSAHASEPFYFVRNLQGRVDEFTILSAPLSAQEILRLYEAGRPDNSPSSSR